MPDTGERTRHPDVPVSLHKISVTSVTLLARKQPSASGGEEIELRKMDIVYTKAEILSPVSPTHI